MDREGASVAANDFGPVVSETNKPTRQAINIITMDASTAQLPTLQPGLPVWRYRYFEVFPNLDPFTRLGTWYSAILPTFLKNSLWHRQYSSAG
ncbi:hypothetical protein BDW71DRAFT_170471 [Aspergillus fruticulosus]